MSLEKSIEKLTKAIQAARIDLNTTPIEYGPDGRMRPAGIQGNCVTQRIQDQEGGSDITHRCMCYYDKADGTRCIVKLTPGICEEQGPVIIPRDMPCRSS